TAAIARGGRLGGRRRRQRRFDGRNGSNHERRRAAAPAIERSNGTGHGAELCHGLPTEARSEMKGPPSRLRRYGGQPARELRLKCPPSRLRRYGGQPARES